MTTFIESFTSVCQSKHRGLFFLSLLSVFLWLIATAFAMLPKVYSGLAFTEYKQAIIYGAMGLSFVFAILSMPKPKAKKQTDSLGLQDDALLPH